MVDRKSRCALAAGKRKQKAQIRTGSEGSEDGAEKGRANEQVTKIEAGLGFGGD